MPLPPALLSQVDANRRQRGLESVRVYLNNAAIVFDHTPSFLVESVRGSLG